jgi:hypothetical protein
MDSELIALRARVAALERTLAAAAATMVVVVVAAPLVTRAAGPTKVTAPFTVVDEAGHALVEIQSTAGGGRLVVYNSAQDRVAEVQASADRAAGNVHVYLAGDSKPKVRLGVNVGDDTGGLELAGVEGGLAQMSGKGLVITNANRQPVATLRQASDSGYLKLWNATTPNVELWSGEQGGGAAVYGSNGAEAATIEGQAGDGKMTLHGSNGVAATLESQTGDGRMTLRRNGAARAIIGVSADDAGLIRLAGATGTSVEVHAANGSFKAVNHAGREVIDLGIDDHGSGILDVRHSAGVGGARLDVSENGAGNLKIHAPPFEIKAQIGTKGDKGDVCVEGGKGLICLSGIAIKTLTPW